jgi:ATP-dependent DNA helicase RecG
MTEGELDELVRQLRASGGDSTAVEVKSAAGGLPASMASTLSAMANLPGGGLVLLGVDERTGFRPVPLADPQALKQALAAKARTFNPPVGLSIEDGLVDGMPVVIAKVHECDSSAKPCRVASTGQAFLRGYDGDYRLSDLEEQAFLAGRKPPMFDREPVADAAAADLDRDLVAGFIANVRDRDPSGFGRFADDAELLARIGVTTREEVPTVAGILALGLQPQQWFPRYVVQLAADPLPGDPSGTRARNQAVLSGSIPVMLESAMTWARRNFDTLVVSRPDGAVQDQLAYPVKAFRELIANALVHRDLDHWSAGRAVEVRLRADRLVISNPGGLYGITAERLGHESVTSARNARLVTICQYVPSASGDSRVVEALATGIPTVTAELERAGLPPASYIDRGIDFTVILRPGARRNATAPRLNKTELRVYDALASGPKTVAELEPVLNLQPATVRNALRSLRSAGLVEQQGGRGLVTVYKRIGDDGS